jgi:hypothetical protein
MPKILIVEDDPAIKDVLKLALSQYLSPQSASEKLSTGPIGLD